MTFEARVGFVIVFLLIWAIIGSIPWAVAAIRMRGRGALPLLPIVVLSAILAGIIVPLSGAKDVTGFWFSLLTALVGAIIASAAGQRFFPRLFPTDADRARVRRPLDGPAGDDRGPTDVSP
jgi:hypothetical protein